MQKMNDSMKRDWDRDWKIAKIDVGIRRKIKEIAGHKMCICEDE